jgi:hypothetical protein
MHHAFPQIELTWVLSPGRAPGSSGPDLETGRQSTIAAPRFPAFGRDQEPVLNWYAVPQPQAPDPKPRAVTRSR